MSGLSTKELGETENPKELVPGEPDQVRTAGQAFSDEARHMDTTHRTLSGLSAPAWEGEAANAFTSSFPTTIRPWSEVAEQARLAGTALDDHAGVLSSAQDKAQQAIDKYRAGKEASEQALAAHNSDVATYNSAIRAPGTIGGGGGSLPPHPGSFEDPGTARMEEAQQLVTEAREMVTESAEATGEALGRLPGARTSGEMPVDESGNPTFTSGSVDMGEVERNRNEYDRQFGDQSLTEGDPSDGPGVSMDLASAEAEASYFGGEVSGQDQFGVVTATGSAGYSAFGADANASAGVQNGNLTASAGVGVHAIQAEASGSLEAGPASLEGAVSGEVGASADVNASIGADGVHAGGEAFAGARAEASGSVDVGGVGATGTAEAWAGAGVEADIGVGMNDDGSFTIGGEFGAALGVGGKLGGEITIDPGAVVDTAEDIGEGISDGVEAAGDALGDVGSGIGDALGF